MVLVILNKEWTSTIANFIQNIANSIKLCLKQVRIWDQFGAAHSWIVIVGCMCVCVCGRSGVDLKVWGCVCMSSIRYDLCRMRSSYDGLYRYMFVCGGVNMNFYDDPYVKVFHLLFPI